MTKPEENKFLRRYTELPALFYMLKNKKVTFLSPTMTWDDKNDFHYIKNIHFSINLKFLFCVLRKRMKDFNTGKYLREIVVEFVLCLKRSYF